MGQQAIKGMKTLRILILIFSLSSAGYSLFQLSWIPAKAWLAHHLIAHSWQSEHRIKPPPWPWADTRPVALMRIPRLNLEYYVLQGLDHRTLAFGPGIEATPGQQNGWLIAAHRDTHFKFLGQLRTDDIIELEFVESQQIYQVTRQQVLPSPELPVSHKTNELFLSTCYPLRGFNSNPQQRLLVRADPIII